MAGLASIAQASWGGSTFWPLTRITFKSRLNHQAIFSAKLCSRSKVG